MRFRGKGIIKAAKEWLAQPNDLSCNREGTEDGVELDLSERFTFQKGGDQVEGIQAVFRR
jgi:hypothetical protein